MMANPPASAAHEDMLFSSSNTIPVRTCAACEAHDFQDHPHNIDPSRQSLYTKFDPLHHGAAAARAAPAAAAHSDKLLDFATPEHASAVSKTAAATSAADFLTGELEAKLRLGDEIPVEDALTSSTASEPGPVRASSLSPYDRLATSHDAPRSGLRYTEADLRRRMDDAVKTAVAEALAAQQGELDGLRAQVAEEHKCNQEMKLVVEQFEQAMMAMVNETKHAQSASTAALEAEKATLASDLSKTEQAFADLHHKYEKLKEIAGNLRKNEEILKAAVETAQQALKKAEERYEGLKAHAEKKIEAANTEIAHVRDQFKNELKLANAKLKIMETELGQTQRKLAAKELDNKELTTICDDMLKQLESRAS